MLVNALFPSCDAETGAEFFVRAASATLRLLVAMQQIGCLLGKSGAVIKAMREATQAQIRVMPKDARPPFALDTDELVQVSFPICRIALASCLRSR